MVEPADVLMYSAVDWILWLVPKPCAPVTKIGAAEASDSASTE